MLASATESAARQSSHETGLRAPHQRLRQPLDADLIGQPRGPGAAAEGRSEAPYDRGGEQRVKERDRPREQETGAREGESDDDREAAAVDVGDDAGGNLEGKDRRFEDGTDKDQLEGVETHRLDLVDEARGDDRGDGESLEGRHADREWVGGQPLHGSDRPAARW